MLSIFQASSVYVVGRVSFVPVPARIPLTERSRPCVSIPGSTRQPVITLYSGISSSFTWAEYQLAAPAALRALPSSTAERGLPGEPNARHDCVPCVCPMSTRNLSRRGDDPVRMRRRLVHLHGSINVLRSKAGETSRQMRCSPGNVGLNGSPWAAVSVAAFSSASGPGSWLQCQTPVAIGMVLDRHSGS